MMHTYVIYYCTFLVLLFGDIKQYTLQNMNKHRKIIIYYNKYLNI